MVIKHIAIVGMGALGVMYGEHLARTLQGGQVEFVGNQARVTRYEAEGVYLQRDGGEWIQVDCPMVSDEGEIPADLLIVAVKSTGLDAALHTMRHKIAEHTIILSVMNGITSEQAIGEVYGHEKLVHCVVQGMDVIKDGNRVRYTQFGELVIGVDERSPEKLARLAAVQHLFEQTGTPHRVEEDIVRRVWSKFMLNVGVNQAVMIHEGTYRTVQEAGEARELMLAAMREVMRLAGHEGIEVSETDYVGYVQLIDGMNPDGMPSMRQDGLAKRKSEIELFAGTVLRLAKRHGLEMPVNQWIYDQVTLREAGYVYSSSS